MAEFRLESDQAAGLRRLFGRPEPRIVSFAAASDGVGKSTLVANLAAALAHAGKEVLVIDENAKNSVAAYYGGHTRQDLQQVVNREKTLADVMLNVAPGVRVLPAARAVARLAKLMPRQQQALVEALTTMEPPADVILVDTSLDHPLAFSPLALASRETVIVVAPSGAVMTEAYALIKKVSLACERRDFRILVSKVGGLQEGRAIYRNFAELTKSRGIARLDFAGCVPNDPQVVQARRLSQSVIGLFPDTPAAKAYRAIARELPNWESAAANARAGGIEKFVEQLLNFTQYQQADPVALYA